MNQRCLPHGKQFGNTCLFLHAGFSALRKQNLFLDLVNNKMLGDPQRQALLCFKPCQLAMLISRVTPGTITSWCDLNTSWLWPAMPSAEERESSLFPRSALPEPADRTVALAPGSAAPAARSAAQLPPASPPGRQQSSNDLPCTYI